MTPIAALAGLALRTSKLDAMADFYAHAFGLAAVASTGHRAAFKGRLGVDSQLRLEEAGERGLSGLRFDVRDRDGLDALAARLAAADVTLVEQVDNDTTAPGFAVIDPDGTVLEFRAIGTASAQGLVDNDRPLFLSHVVINSPDAPRLVDFYTRVLGFTVSDAYEKGLLTFLRCDQPQHHCIGISPGEAPGLNHFAMDCGDVDALMRSIVRMRDQGHEPVWGPGRHGPGGNIFCYYEDPDGFVPEFTCDVLQIADPAHWQAKEWPRTPANANVWGTGGPTPRAVALMSGAPEARA